MTVGYDKYYFDKDGVLYKTECTHKLATIPAVAPTCTKTGLTEGKRCTICNKIITAQKTVPAKGHKLNETIIKKATCTEEGEKVVTCENCDYSKTVTIPAKGHTVVIDKAVEPTCTNTGLTEGKHCSVCGAVIVAQKVVPKIDHNIVIDNAVEPTCTINGLTEGSHCSMCGMVFKAQEIIPAKGHTVVIDKAVEPTCTKNGLTEGSHCSVCGTTIVKQNEIPATGHTFHEEITKQPTCTEEGEKVVTCENCDYSKTVTIPAKGHTEVIDKAVEATCTKTGLTEGKHCSVCHEVIVAQTVVPVKEHTIVIDPYVAPTCNEAVNAHVGYTEGSHCSVCGTVFVEQEEIPMHTHLESFHYETEEPTCTEIGHKYKICDYCNNGSIEEDIPAKGHTWDNGVVTTAPTCSKEGVKTYTCKICGEHRTEPIAKTAHNWGEEFVEKETYGGGRARVTMYISSTGVNLSVENNLWTYEEVNDFMEDIISSGDIEVNMKYGNGYRVVTASWFTEDFYVKKFTRHTCQDCHTTENVSDELEIVWIAHKGDLVYNNEVLGNYEVGSEPFTPFSILSKNKSEPLYVIP
jgi:hypothetical protein